MDKSIFRLATYTSWPEHSPVSALALSDAGFYYTKSEDQVKCFDCGICVSHWKDGDVPLHRHLQASPQCSYVLSKTGGLGQLSRGQTSQENSSQDGNTTTQTRSQSNSGYTAQMTLPDQMQNLQIQEPGRNQPDRHQLHDYHTNPVQTPILKNPTSTSHNNTRPVDSQNTPLWTQQRKPAETNQFPEQARPNLEETTAVKEPVNNVVLDYTVAENRLSSFIGRWKADAPVSVSELVKAGLYFTGPGDRVQCAWCRGGLYNWEPGDSAIDEHRRHFAQCPFIINKLWLQTTPTQSQPFPPPRQQQRSEVRRETTPPTTTQRQHFPSPRQQQQPEVRRETTIPTTQRQHFPAPQQPQPQQQRQQQPEARRQAESEHMNLRSSGPVIIALQMGYSEDTAVKAAKYLLSTGKQLTADELMDTIFQLEDTDIVMSEGSADEGDMAQSRPFNSDLSLRENPPDHSSVSSNDPEMLRLQEENTQLRSTTICKVCMDNTINLLFLPCRHLVCCESCGEVLNECPLCRTAIVGTVKTYLS